MPLAPVTRAMDAQVAVDRAERTIVATINTAAVDRYKTVIVPEGGNFGPYRNNPVVLYNHQSEGNSLPIGKNLWIKPKGSTIIALTKFLPQGKLDLADKVFELYDLGFLNGWSISILPIEQGPPTSEDIRKNPQWATARIIYRKWDLLEYSCVTLPCNAETVRQAQSRGLSLPGWKVDPAPTPSPAAPVSKALDLPPLRGRTLEDVQRSVERQLLAQLGGTARELVVKDATELARGMV